MDTDQDLRATEYEIAENLRSIRELMPAGPARTCLEAMARVGRDVYAYNSGGPPPLGTPCVWIETVRVPIVDYVARFASTGNA
jgi:hypothetical protein